MGPAPAAVPAGEEEVVRSPDAFLILITLLLLLLSVLTQWRGRRGGGAGAAEGWGRVPLGGLTPNHRFSASRTCGFSLGESGPGWRPPSIPPG